MDTKFGFGKMVDLGFEEAVDTVTEELGKEGFGVLTEIDVQATLKTKLDVDSRPYRILGACNPQLAHRAMSGEPFIGVLLPCNVVVMEREGGGSIVAALKPTAAFTLSWTSISTWPRDNFWGSSVRTGRGRPLFFAPPSAT